MPKNPPSKRNGWLGWGAVLFLGALLFLALLRGANAGELFKRALDWIAGLGAAAPAVFIFVYILACVLLLPGSVLTLGAGFLFGVVRGSIVVSVASTLGATAAFIAGRYFARGWVRAQVERVPKFKAIDEAVGREGWKIVALTRLSPVFPFNLLNYAYGLTAVRLRDYVIASWIGMMPGTVLYVYLGSLAGSLAALGTGRSEKSPAEWAFFAAGLTATAVVTVYVTRLARKALNTRVSSGGGE